MKDKNKDEFTKELEDALKTLKTSEKKLDEINKGMQKELEKELKKEKKKK